MPVGECALCLKTGELQDSHLMPKGTYKPLRGKLAAQDPILVTASITVQTSAQVHDYLLCKDCELRFERNGEDWVMKNWERPNGRFPLRDALLRSPIKSTIPTGDLYKAPFDSSFKLEKLIYFAASIFWRASVHNWDRAKHLMTRTPLPADVQEQFRKFLLDVDPFPPDLVLLISVTASKPVEHLVMPAPMAPASPTAAPVKAYNFAIPGLQFRLYYENVTEEMKKASVTCPPHAIVVTDRVEMQILTGAEELRKTSRPIGKLKRKNNHS
jgi:hypothetical protein